MRDPETPAYAIGFAGGEQFRVTRRLTFCHSELVSESRSSQRHVRDSETLVSAGGYDVGEQLRVTRDVLQFVILNSFQNLLLRTHHVRDSEASSE